MVRTGVECRAKSWQILTDVGVVPGKHLQKPPPLGQYAMFLGNRHETGIGEGRHDDEGVNGCEKTQGGSRKLPPPDRLSAVLAASAVGIVSELVLSGMFMKAFQSRTTSALMLW